MPSRSHLTILGGGLAGLAVGRSALAAGWEVTVLEGADQPGGLARTLAWGPFRFDTGAHRLHGHDPDLVADLSALLGPQLLQVDAPSRIYRDGRFHDFPLTPLNLWRDLGPGPCLRIAWELLARWRSGGGDDFAALARRRYGPTLAGLFLLNYTEKLWGRPGGQLAATVAGTRLQGLTLTALLKEAVGLTGGRTRHLEGTFYYPASGIGLLAERLAASLGPGRLRPRSVVTALRHRQDRVEEVEINGREKLPVATVLSSLPLPVLIRLLSPPPPERLLVLARRLAFRDLKLVALFLNQERVGPNATVYFPGQEFLFNRVSEPRNRSPWMAPEGRTSLVAELACEEGDQVWGAADGPLVARVTADLAGLGWFEPGAVLGATVVRLDQAYPILTLAALQALAEIRDYLGRFNNLVLAGRGGLFQYLDINATLAQAKEVTVDLGRRSS